MIEITIDDRVIHVEPGTTVLKAALSEGIKIPTLCYHRDLLPYGACRVCLVEIVAGGKPGLQASCMYKATAGLVVKTATDRVKRARKIIFELLLARSPGSEKVVALAREFGVTETRFTKATNGNCILCGLCERVCASVSKRHAISFAYRGTRRKIQTPFGEISEPCIGCGACAYVCPTGTIKIEPV